MNDNFDIPLTKCSVLNIGKALPRWLWPRLSVCALALTVARVRVVPVRYCKRPPSQKVRGDRVVVVVVVVVVGLVVVLSWAKAEPLYPHHNYILR